jgi:hypothetical protein
LDMVRGNPCRDAERRLNRRRHAWDRPWRGRSRPLRPPRPRPDGPVIDSRHGTRVQDPIAEGNSLLRIVSMERAAAWLPYAVRSGNFMAWTFETVAENLADEFGDVHPAEMVIRCVEAARHSAEEVIGDASPELVERIARKHLEVLALAAAEGHGGD